MSKKIAFVTGSARGIGQAICQRFMADGLQIIGLDQNPDAANPWPEIHCDLSQTETIEQSFQDVLKSSGAAPDILVNNAGLYDALDWQALSVEQYQKTLSVNATACYAVTKLWAQALIKAKKPGVAINISSICAEIGAINPAYAASKAAINAMTISFAKALAPHSIRVNAIAPGPIETAMGNKIPQDRQAEFIKRIALGRFGLPQEIAAVAAFLAGEDASYITGAVIPVDGGFI